MAITRAVVRMLDIWDTLCSYFCSYADVDKPGNVRSICQMPPNNKALALFPKKYSPYFSIYFQTSSTATVHKVHGETKDDSFFLYLSWSISC